VTPAIWLFEEWPPERVKREEEPAERRPVLTLPPISTLCVIAETIPGARAAGSCGELLLERLDELLLACDPW